VAAAVHAAAALAQPGGERRVAAGTQEHGPPRPDFRQVLRRPVCDLAGSSAVDCLPGQHHARAGSVHPERRICTAPPVAIQLLKVNTGANRDSTLLSSRLEARPGRPLVECPVAAATAAGPFPGCSVVGVSLGPGRRSGRAPAMP
jgi:hypothetical protein